MKLPIVEMRYTRPCGCRTAVLFFHEGEGSPRGTIEGGARQLAALVESDSAHVCPREREGDQG